ncbi:di- and tricarboxylate transporters [Candidatus Scalindua japonica]|uniref:Di-and tricarboxylate transporters n=1 Tax=Candidatus Scalindua japonica TaxID=1284222 RepID=A0A286U256_9BACT|nr:hypothetical protein [Candidatus Scalindua japonica]GAX62141.1 di- and tricarboxylate transporters [Candidatus Scalindua japonica]
MSITVKRTKISIGPDPTRVILKSFIPGDVGICHPKPDKRSSLFEAGSGTMQERFDLYGHGDAEKDTADISLYTE